MERFSDKAVSLFQALGVHVLAALIMLLGLQASEPIQLSGGAPLEAVMVDLSTMASVPKARPAPPKPTPPTPPPPAQVVCDDPITVATDASVSRGITGFGVLADDGQYQLMAFPHQRKQIGSQPVLVAELRGINEAVRKFGHRPLTILTDSQESVAMVNRWRAGDEVLPRGYTTDRAVGLAGLVEAQRRVRKHRDRIDIRWVRGHDGHLLNEGADALAKLARRYRLPGSGLTPSEYRRRAAGLADGFAAAQSRGSPGRT